MRSWRTDRKEEERLARDGICPQAVQRREEEGDPGLPEVYGGGETTRETVGLVGGGLIRSLGGWSQVLSLRDSKKDLRHDARILGGGDFVQDILRDADRSLRRQLKLGERSRSIDQAIKRMCEGEGIREEELRNGGQRREVSRLRAKISSHLSHALGIPMAEIARHVGLCGSAVIKAIQKMESANQDS